MHHTPAESPHEGGEFETKGIAYCDTDATACLGTLERKTSNNSDNDVTTTLSTTSSSQGSIQVLADTYADVNQEVSPGRRPTRSPRRKSSLGKTDSMIRGSANAQDFFGAERVFHDIDHIKTTEFPPPDRDEENHTCDEAKKIVEASAATNNFQHPSKDTVKSKPLQIQPAEESINPHYPQADTSSEPISEAQVNSRCQCIIL